MGIVLFGIAWLWNLARGGGVFAQRVAWTALAAPLVVMVLIAVTPADFHISFALARVAAAALIAYGILRHQLFDIDVKLRWTISRSTIAAAFVAAFFVASEDAQLLFGAENEVVGLFAAGALVFAIAPLQRAAERLAEKAVPVVPRIDANASSPTEPSFRKAVRLALRDRRLTRDEEGHLHELARDLGLDGARAHAIIAEIEREAPS